MFVLFLRLCSVAALLLYLTDSPDRLTEDKPAEWTEERLEYWMRKAGTDTGYWWELCIVTEELYRMGLLHKNEYRNGWLWLYVYRRAVGRPLPVSEDEYFGWREMHPKN